MARRGIRFRGYGVEVEIPDSTASRLRRHPASAPESTDGQLLFWPTPLEPTVVQRDAAEAVRFFQADPNQPAPPVDDAPSWYHTIELPDGRVTPGQFDHRRLVPSYGLPATLENKTALDVATFDGFWAFEMERRGAAVTAVDLDDMRNLDFPDLVRQKLTEVPMPIMGSGFEIAKASLGSSVHKVVSSVYDLAPEKVGTFDFVHVADLLLHLRRPLAALTAMRSVCTGELLLVDVIDPSLTRGTYGPTTQYRGGWNDITWWVPSLDALAQMVIDAGFASVAVNTVYQLAKTQEPTGYWRASLSATV
jgi:tRNA (mo5U34)-methyltransferase